MKHMFRRSLCLALILLLSFEALAPGVSAELSDIAYPVYFEAEEAEPEYTDADPGAAAGIGGDTIILPVLDDEDDEDDEDEETDPNPLNYEELYYSDFYKKEDDSWGNVPKGTTTALVPSAVDNRIDLYFEKKGAKLESKYAAKLDKADTQIQGAEQRLEELKRSYNAKQGEIRRQTNNINRKFKGKKNRMLRKQKINQIKKNPYEAKVNRGSAKVEKLKTKKADIGKAKAGKLDKLKWARGALKTAMALVTIYFAWQSLSELLDDPSVGYKSPFLEALAVGIRGDSALFAFLSLYPPFAPAALAFAIAEMIVTSETMKAIMNKYFPDLGFLDYTTEAINMTQRDIFKVLIDLFNSGERAARLDQLSRESVFKTNRYSSTAVSGMLPPGVYELVRGATACATHINAYKPNIYLYPAEPTQMTLRFEHPTAVSVSDPLYPAEGWQLTAYPDGTLYSAGTRCGYLFYEAVTSDRYYQREEGYLIPAEDRAGSFSSILAGYGLNEREIADFNDYWCEKLEPGCDYAMYPQLTAIVDEAMPLTVTPAPDTVLRLWFAFVKGGTPAAAAVPQALVRSGSSLVEWGGFFLDE